MALTLPSKQANQYTTSKQLIGGDDFNNLVAQLNSSKTGITAHAGGGQTAATQLDAHVNIISVVATAADSVKLPKGFPGLQVWIQNIDAADDAQVFTYGVGTIDNTNGAATGVALNNTAATATLYTCLYVDSVLGDIWISK